MTSNTVERIMEFFDRCVLDLSPSVYREVLDDTMDQLQSRLDCLNEENEGEEE